MNGVRVSRPERHRPGPAPARPRRQPRPHQEARTRVALKSVPVRASREVATETRTRCAGRVDQAPQSARPGSGDPVLVRGGGLPRGGVRHQPRRLHVGGRAPADGRARRAGAGPAAVHLPGRNRVRPQLGQVVASRSSSACRAASRRLAAAFSACSTDRARREVGTPPRVSTASRDRLLRHTAVQARRLPYPTSAVLEV